MAKERDEEVQHPAGEGDGIATPPDTSRPTIDVSSDPDDDEPAPAQQRGGAPQDKSKRVGYGEWKRAAKDWESKYSKLEQEVAELRGRASAPAPVIIREGGGQQAPQVDPADAAIDALEAQQQALLSALSTPGLPTDQAAKYTKQWNQLDRQRHKMIAKQAQAELRGSMQGPGPDDMDAAAAKQILTADFPKIMESPYYKALAIAETNRIAAEARQAPNLSHARQGAALIYQRYNLGPQKGPAPTDAQRAKYEATGTRPAAGGKSEWTPSKQEYKLAMSYTEHRKGLSETQRLRAYHDEVLKPAGLGRAS